jgi:hypothetical protein
MEVIFHFTEKLRASFVLFRVDGWLILCVGGGGNKASLVKLMLGAGTELGNVLFSSRVVSYYWC